ncbi:MAG TPA: hypothetical protein ENN51_07080 [candidate division WOR-3 bacterium]|uniref:JAB domain-containing protein n=1 Tax=candidate division WOR-3 bacterium TaxID=2052148 RepID=A0A7V0XFV2_UNCW3|nr:hypothetical protein [candidate division WOR-3 bacterium]
MPNRPPVFGPPVLFNEEAVRELCRLARQGYETRNKRETFGFLYGNIVNETGPAGRAPLRRLVVRHARYYRGGTKTRYRVTLDEREMLRRRRGLARELHQRFLGSFHSHVEVAGFVSRGISADDRASFRADREALVETLVSVWAGRRKTLRPTPKTIVAWEPETGYHYRIRAYVRQNGGVRRIRVRVIRSGVVIVY